MSEDSETAQAERGEVAVEMLDVVIRFEVQYRIRTQVPKHDDIDDQREAMLEILENLLHPDSPEGPSCVDGVCR